MQIYSKFNRSRYDERFEVDPNWRRWYEQNVKCTHCESPKRKWQEDPATLNVDLMGSFPGCTTSALGCSANLVREDLREALNDYLPMIVWGGCYILTARGRNRLPFLICQMPAREWVNPFRGPGNRHKMCPGCGRVFCPHFGEQALLAYDVGGRPVVADESGDLYIRRDLAEELKLTQRFADLRLLKIPVIPEPLDDWILPGDPGWDGVLHMKYPAGLGVQIYLPDPHREERVLYRELEQRLKNELASIDAGHLRRERGSQGSCLFQVDGLSTESLRRAALRAIRGWRVEATFYVSLHQFDREGDPLVESFSLSGVSES